MNAAAGVLPMGDEEPQKDSVWGIVLGIIVTLLGVYLIEATIFPALEALEFMVPMGVFVVLLWVGAYRSNKKKQAGS
jgi:amino acid transporter